jgi:MSHA biogenesis protein MshE
VGEMRDAETAEIGLRAAITGHLLLSTLHTKDTVSTPFRLLDMGAPPFMVATSLQAVLAQRLLRGVCKHCAEPHLASPQEQAWINEVLAMNGEAPGPVKSVAGRGCSECNGTGYQGRRGIYEMLEMDPDMALAIQNSDAGAFLAAARKSLRGKTLADRSMDLVREGKTSLAEAVRVSVNAE